jgi:DNA-binding SARP family transcriptional activator
MKFLVLGTLKITTDDGTWISVPQAKKRALLCCMCLRAGQLMSFAELLNAVWGEDEWRLRSTLHTHIWGIRRLSRHLSDRLESHTAGYRLRASEDEVDALQFRRLTRDGDDLLRRGELERACVKLEGALTLWTDTPLADFPATPTLEGESLALLEEKYLTEENLMDAQLACGSNARLVPALIRFANAQPLRERRWEQLMIALYRSERKAEALQTYLMARDNLIGRVGVEPGYRLREMHRRILSNDTELLSMNVRF